MKTSLLISALVVYALSAPSVCAQDKPVLGQSLMNMEKQICPMQENIKIMQHQMNK